MYWMQVKYLTNILENISCRIQGYFFFHYWYCFTYWCIPLISNF